MTALDLPDAGRAACSTWTRLGVLLLALGGPGCGSRSAPPVWISLARGFEPRPLEELVEAWERAEPGPTGTQVESQPPGLSLRHEIRSADWQPSAARGCFSAPLPLGAFRRSGMPARLVGRGREYPHAAAGRAPTPGEIRVEGSRLSLRLAAEANQVVPPTVLLLARPAGTQSEHALPSSAWRKGDQTGSFWLQAPNGVTLGDTARLFAELVRVEARGTLAPFEYRVADEGVTLCWPDGTPPAAELVARLENGRVADGQWQLRLGRFCGNGIPVWSGAREQLVCDLPRASQLAFRFVHGAAAHEAEVRARVRLDGAVLFEQSFAARAWAEPQLVTLELPPEGKRGARIAFEVEGPPGLGVFFTPLVAPRERGSALARPWPARADIVLFLADTFRADGLALQGGDPALAPSLNRFAAGALAFPRARSNAAWTLPSISSLLTGLHPGQHGATDEDLGLSAAHTTIAERLAQAGYRTGAITDGSFFAPVFGLDQGFEWFAQHDPPAWDLDRTLAEARAFLEQDDGRPVFLVVHTYRTHQPYRVGPDEDASAYDRLMDRARVVAGTNSPAPAAGLELLSHYQAELRALYQEGVRDLDRGFGGFLAWLEARRFFEHGTLVFTSDHGESLGENHDFFHGGHLWETKLHVPLLLRGPGLAPRVAPHRAGPLDLAPTFAALAGLVPDPEWVGSSLLTLARERTAFAFQLGAKSRQVACVDQERKLILTPEEARLASGSCEEAFDLARDPHEEHNLAAGADWPAELTRALAPAIRGFLQARGQSERAGVSAELRAQLDELGYGGGAR